MKRYENENFRSCVGGLLGEGIGSCAVEAAAYGIGLVVYMVVLALYHAGLKLLNFGHEPDGERLALILFDWISVAVIYYAIKQVIMRRNEMQFRSRELIESGEAWRYK